MFIYKQLSCWFLKIAIMLCGKNVLSKLYNRFSFFGSELSQQTFVGLQDIFWRRLQHAFSIKVFVFYEDILQDVLKTFKTSSRRYGRSTILCWRHLEDITWRRLQKMSWRCLEDMPWKRLQDTLETNKLFTGDVRCYVTNLYLTNLYLTNLGEVQNALVRTK